MKKTVIKLAASLHPSAAPKITTVLLFRPDFYQSLEFSVPGNTKSSFLFSTPGESVFGNLSFIYIKENEVLFPWWQFYIWSSSRIGTMVDVIQNLPTLNRVEEVTAKN